MIQVFLILFEALLLFGVTAAELNKPYGKSSQRKLACNYIFFNIRNMSDCVDNHEDCEYWAGIEECDKNPGYMLINCKKSCEICRGESIKGRKTS